MGRLRNASRIWHEAATASQVMVPCNDAYFTVELATWFNRHAPLELELGAGRGEFIIERASAMPERDFLAIESAPTIAQLMGLRAMRRGLSNLRVARMDARALVNLMLPAASIDACHIYFPDPWPKGRHAKHRLITPYFLGSLARTLKIGAPLFIATDVAKYAQRSFAMLSAAGFRQLSLAVPGASETGFAKKFIAEGRPIHAGAFAAPDQPTIPD
jgi:tRNA (guanine-N7-)-methyltransferase